MRNSVTTVIVALVIASIAVFTAGGVFAESNPNWHFKLTGADGTLTEGGTYTVEISFIPDYLPAEGQPNDGPNALKKYSLDVGYDTGNLEFVSITYYTYDLGGQAKWVGGQIETPTPPDGTIQYVNGALNPPFLVDNYRPDEENNHLATITFNAKSTGTFQNLVWWVDPGDLGYAVVDGIEYAQDPLILWKEDGVPVGTRDQNGTYEPYVLHLGVSETPPLDTFPQETTPAGVPYYTAVASARQALRFLSGDGYTWPDQDALYTKYHSGPKTEDMSPQDLTTMLNALTYYDTQSLWYRIYHFGVNSDTDEDMAIKRLIHWIDFKVPGVPVPPTDGYPPQPNAPAHVPMYGGYNWVTVRGFDSDFAPTEAGSVWTIPQNMTVYGLWLNDPKSTGIGYNVYMTGDAFKSNYYLIGGYYLSVAEPPVLEAEQELEEHLDEITIGYVRGRPNAELAGTFQEKLELRQSILNGDLSSELSQRELLRKTEAIEDQLTGVDWSAIVPSELLSSPDFSGSFKGAGYHKSLRVANLDTAQDYELLLFGKAVSGDSASAVLLMDPADGSFQQASWTAEDQAFLSESQALRIAANALGVTFPIRHQELEAWNKRTLARSRLFTTVEPVLSSRLIWAAEFGQSVFRPVYEIPTPFGPTVYVMQDGTYTIKGEVNPEFLGEEPGTAGPEESLSGSAAQVPPLTSAQALKRFEDQALASLPLISVTAFAPENGTGTDRVQQAEVWLRISPESSENAALIMARTADLYREVTGVIGPVRVTRWQGSTRLESLQF